MKLDLKRVLEQLEVFGYPIFSLDINKDELLEHKSFFIYDDNTGITPGENRLQYQIGFSLLFITFEEAQIDQIEVALQLSRAGLIFDNSTHNIGKLQDTDQVATTITWQFHSLVRAMIK